MRLPVALEITPPKTPKRDVLLRRARLLGERAEAVHVIQRPDRVPSLDAAIELRAAGIRAVWHWVNRGKRAEELEAELERAVRAGLDSLLLVRGEAGPPEVTPPPKLAELVARARAQLPAARIGVTANPHLARERVLANLWPKLAAGASFVQTQPIFALAELAPLAEVLRTRAASVRIVPMLIPLPSVSAAERLGERLRLPLPDTLLRRLETGGEPAGWQAFAELAHQLADSGLCDAVAVMTHELDPPKSFGERIAAALG